MRCTAHPFRRGILCFLMPVFLLLISLTPTSGQGWKAGTAKRIITPTDSVWMAGYASRTHSATGTLHDLWIKALALEDSLGHRGLLITTDLLGLPRALSERVSERLMKRLDIGRDQLILSSSHTHSGPVLQQSLYPAYPLSASRQAQIDRYTQELEEALVALGVAAFEAMRPASLASGQGTVRFGVNRRNNVEATLSAATDLAGPIDHSVPVMLVRDAEGQPMTVVFGYACHATVLSLYQWSGDYPGFAQLALEAAFPGVTAMFFAGAGGDINPLPRRSVALARQYGEELASAVRRVVAEELEPLAPVLDTRYTEIALAYGPRAEREELVHLQHAGSPYEQVWARELLANLDAGKPIPQSYPTYPVQSWQLGHQRLVALGGEVVVEYAIRLKRLLGQDLFVMAYANDVMNYIPSLRILREGGYEGFSSSRVYNLPAPWAPTIEEILIRTTYEQVQTLPTPIRLTGSHP